MNKNISIIAETISNCGDGLQPKYFFRHPHELMNPSESRISNHLVIGSLWAGLTNWRHLWCYIQLSKQLTLGLNFIRRAHYVTEELLAHAGINHQLSLFLSFPELDVTEYSLRNAGKRSLEAIHGIFRGRTTSLPIASANLSFQEFLTRMNKMVQIKRLNINSSKLRGIQLEQQKRRESLWAKTALSSPLYSCIWQTCNLPPVNQ